jgi:predicted homoserine dehydrogenase-like protein
MVKKDRLNSKLYNSFTDGTKAAIEMAAVTNGTGLDRRDRLPSRISTLLP